MKTVFSLISRISLKARLFRTLVLGTPFLLVTAMGWGQHASISGTASVCQNAAAPVITFTVDGGKAPFIFTYTLNGGSEQNLVLPSGNTVTISAPTGEAGIFIYVLVKVTDALNKNIKITGRGSATITVNALPVALLTCSDADQTFYKGANVTFNASGGTLYDFMVNGLSVQKGVSSIYSTTALSDGQVVSVLVTNISGCSKTSSGIEVKVITLPAGWQFNPADYSYKGQVTGKVLIDNSAVESGFLAAFAGDECRGISEALYYQQNDYNFGVICYSNTISGETLTFQYYDPVKDEIYKIDKSVEFNSGMILGTPSSPVVMNNCVNFNVSFPVNWSWFSVNTLIADMSLNNLLSSCATDGDYIKNQEKYASLINGVWTGPLTKIEPNTLYKIKVQNGCGINFCGKPVDVDATLISLVKGWNWISYVSPGALPINSALASFSAVNQDYIKNQVKYAEYVQGFGWIGTLTSLTPSEGYMMKVANQGTIHFPGTPAKNSSESMHESKMTSLTSNEYEYNGSITAKVLLDGNLAGSEDDFLFAYVDEEIRGFTRGLYFDPSHNFIYPLMIHSNLNEGEIIHFRYYNAERNKVYQCRETVPFKSDMIIADALKSFEFNVIAGQITAVDDIDGNLKLHTYPNPVDNILNIEYEITELTLVRLTVYDPYGKSLQILVDQKLEPGRYNIQWASDSEPGGVYMVKLQTGDRMVVQKVIVIP